MTEPALPSPPPSADAAPTATASGEPDPSVAEAALDAASGVAFVDESAAASSAGLDIA